MTDLPLDQVRTLLAVVDEGTFDAAASALHVTPSAVSQRVKALEQRTGRVLLTRTKPVRATESGEVVVRFARQLARLERDARAELGMTGAGEPTRVSIAVNADSLATWFLGALARLPAEPRLCFELRREDEDHTAALLREGQVMAAVTSSPDAVAGCSVRALGRMRYVAVASPEFAEAYRGGPLRDAPVVNFDRRDDFQDGFVRRLPGEVRGSEPGAALHPHLGGFRGCRRRRSRLGHAARGTGRAAAASGAAGSTGAGAPCGRAPVLAAVEAGLTRTGGGGRRGVSYGC